MTQARKATFEWHGDRYQAYTNGKEYKNRTVYFSSTRVGGTYEVKGSYSIENEEFVDYKAGELDQCKAAARALGIIE